jgi:hypothetical protein
MTEREYFRQVARRPGMFVGRATLERVEGFLMGYQARAGRDGGADVFGGWRDWLVLRRGKDCNHGWSGQVRHIALPEGWEGWDLSPEQEQRVIDALFQLLDEYLAEVEGRPEGSLGDAAD